MPSLSFLKSTCLSRESRIGVSNGKVHISLIPAVFVMVSHHFLWGRIFKTGNDCKEDGDKEQGRDNPRLHLKVRGRGKEHASRGQGPTCYPEISRGII